MNCPFCKSETKVLDSRASGEGETVRRRRKCVTCHFRFSTLEEARILDLVVVKRDGRREPYNRSKLERSLEVALGKRSHTADDYHTLIHAIELNIQSDKNHEITTSQIGEIVMKHLHGFDKVGYIRFASVYRDFEDTETFEQELKKLNLALEQDHDNKRPI